MPSLYSQVKLADGSDNTADLRQYASEQAQREASPSFALCDSRKQTQPRGPIVAENLPLQPILCVNAMTSQGLMPRQGTGRAVTHRGFDLQLRYRHMLHAVCTWLCSSYNIQTSLQLQASNWILPAKPGGCWQSNWCALARIVCCGTLLAALCPPVLSV